jgi:hypothetical protein
MKRVARKRTTAWGDEGQTTVLQRFPCLMLPWLDQCFKGCTSTNSLQRREWGFYTHGTIVSSSRDVRSFRSTAAAPKAVASLYESDVDWRVFGNKGAFKIISMIFIWVLPYENGGMKTKYLCKELEILMLHAAVKNTSASSVFCPLIVFNYFLCLSEYTAIISLNSVNLLRFVMETRCVFFEIEF